MSNTDYEVKLLPYTIESVSDNTNEVPYGVSMIKSPRMWDKGITGKNKIVAIIDTGVDDRHPDLQGQVIDGYNCFTDDKNYIDDNGHGTHCAGTIAAKSDGAGVVGVAYDVKILAVKALNADGNGSYSNIIKGINYAIDWVGKNGEKVNVISMSLGGPADIPELHEAVKRAVDNNILVVCAAGNSGDGNADTDEKSYPGDYPEVVEVGACDSIADIATFSNSNDEVDLVAPGVSILSTYLNNGYAKLSGTSMSTPHTAASAILTAIEWEEANGRQITEAELYAQLIKKTEKLPNYDAKQQGNGLIQLDRNQPIVTPRDPKDIPLEEALNGLYAKGTIDSPEFWMNMYGKYLKGELKNEDFLYVDLLIKKFYADKN